MKLTVLFLFLLSAFIILIFYNYRTNAFSAKKMRLFTIGGIVVLSMFLFYMGTGTITKNISRIFIQSSPKSPSEVFTILFRSQPDSCTSFTNFQDQVIPKVDCCIWMELLTCPEELKKIATVHNYSANYITVSDSVELKTRFDQRPDWWQPQRLNGTIHEMYYRFENGNEQTLIFNSDSTVVFVCDSAP